MGAAPPPGLRSRRGRGAAFRARGEILAAGAADLCDRDCCFARVSSCQAQPQSSQQSQRCGRDDSDPAMKGWRMGFYQRHVLPHLISFAMSNKDLAVYRQRVVPAARGRVLEIGIGSGLNLPLYSGSVDWIIGLDASPELLDMARRGRDRSSRRLDLIQASAEAIALENQSADTVVMTWALCSVPDVRRALQEVRRVLKPSGELLFVEHGAAPDPRVAVWQDRLTPLWKRVAGGCHLNRNVGELLKETGFTVPDLATGYMHGPRIATFMYEGRARPR